MINEKVSVYPWQQTQWNHFLSQWQQDRLPQAFLFSGMEGLGQLDFARLVARRVLCENKNTEKNCTCRPCHLFNVGNHPDFFMLEPEAESRSIKVDQIRQLSERLNVTAHQGAYQVAIISPADSMNRAASNALLKTLEEPNGNVLIILIAYQAGMLLPTIVSRCQRMPFSVREPSLSQLWLREKIPSENVELLLKMAEYAPLKALSLSQEGYITWRDKVLLHFQSMAEKRINPMAPVSEWLKTDMSTLLRIILSITNDLLRLQLNTSINYIQNSDQIESLRLLSAPISCLELQHFVDHVYEALRLVENNLNPNLQLLLESVLLEFNALR